MLAVKEHVQDLQDDLEAPGVVFERGYFIGEGWYWEIGLASIGQGNPNAAAHTQQAVDLYSPDVILFVGVAGGLKDVQIGDVVACDEVFAYEYSKEVEIGGEQISLPRVHSVRASARLVARAYAQSGKAPWGEHGPAQVDTHGDARAFVGPIAAGEKVQEATRGHVYDYLRRNFSHALGVEMEGYGFMLTAFDHAESQAMVIRGISDLLANKAESDAGGSQKLAARNAAAFAFQLLRSLESALIKSSTEYMSRINNLMASYNVRLQQHNDLLKFYAARPDVTPEGRESLANSQGLTIEEYADRLEPEVADLHRANSIEIANERHWIDSIAYVSPELRPILAGRRRVLEERRSTQTALVRTLRFSILFNRQITEPNRHLRRYGRKLTRVQTNLVAEHFRIEIMCDMLIKRIDALLG